MTSERFQTPLADLCKYYLGCLSRDAVRDFGVLTSNQRQYVELLQLPLLPDTTSDVWDDPPVKDFLQRFIQERRRLDLYLGYPVRLMQSRSSGRRQNIRVEPLLVFELQFQQEDVYPSLVDLWPDLNLRALRDLSDHESVALAEETRQFQEDLGFSELINEPDLLAELLRGMPTVREAWPWREDIEPDLLPIHPELAAVNDEGIFNRAILLTSESSPYTRGLVEELRALQRMPESSVRETALAGWLDETESSASHIKDDRSLLEVFPLNMEQRSVVYRAMRQPLTVVTGPPGTGKSQVVASIVANCAWRGEKVLVASKSHKAVDVVEERVNTLDSRPLLLRLGPNRYENALAAYMNSLLSALNDPQDAIDYQESISEYQQKLQERKQALSQLDDVVRARNQLDELEQCVQQAREQLGSDVFARIRAVDVDRARIQLRDTSPIVVRATRGHQDFLTRVLWPLLRSRRLEHAEQAVDAINWICEELDSPSPPRQIQDGSDLKEILDQLENRLSLAATVSRYFDAVNDVASRQMTSDITRDLMSITSAVEGITQRLWRSWLRLQSSRLSGQERKLLADYKALLEMKISADAAGEWLGGSAIQRLVRMFPSVASLFPAWAITNLSARGRLPLDPGFFDVLVIDEASQCDIASALPLLFRSKRAVIIGDPQQLRHITQLSPGADLKLLQENNLADGWSYSRNSLYDRAVSLVGNQTLRDHHRSASDIIGFSNAHFYDGRLRVATKHETLRFPDPDSSAIKWVNVLGTVKRPPGGSAFNQEEATVVVNELERLLVDGQYQGSVGVISPFRLQVNKIRDLVHRNERIMQTISSSSLLIETVYKFQGDERDVVLFSPVISGGTPSTTLRFLANSPNTFNVAVTRARATLIVVGDQQACSNSGVDHIEAFAEYVVTGQKWPSGQSSHEVAELAREYPPVSNPDEVSDWERWFYQVLFDYGLRPIPQYSVDQYRVDFAIFREGRMLAIEIDGEYYHRAWTGELVRQDQIRNARLLELGWDVMRFWVYQIRDDTQQCVDRILDWYRSDR